MTAEQEVFAYTHTNAHSCPQDKVMNRIDLKFIQHLERSMLFMYFVTYEKWINLDNRWPQLNSQIEKPYTMEWKQRKKTINKQYDSFWLKFGIIVKRPNACGVCDPERTSYNIHIINKLKCSSRVSHIKSRFTTKKTLFSLVNEFSLRMFTMITVILRTYLPGYSSCWHR